MVNCTSKSGLHPKGGDRTCPLCGPRNYKDRASAVLEKLGIQSFESEDEAEESFWVNDDGVMEVMDISDYETAFPDSEVTTCGHCQRSWDDAHVSGLTPAPSARCPFEYEHEYDNDEH